MKNETTKNDSGNRLEALQKRIDETRQKMAAEQERLRKREAKEQERLFRIVGEACCEAAKNRDYQPMVEEILNQTVTDERARAFLRQKGMLQVYGTRN